MFRSIIIILILFVVSCKQQKSNEYDALIDKDKIKELTETNRSDVFFNHLYIVVDSLTYARLIENGGWHEVYANFDEGLPNFNPINENTSTCYLRGHQHYIEILGPNNRYNEPVGKSGLGFMLENPKEHFHLGLKPKIKK